MQSAIIIIPHMVDTPEKLRGIFFTNIPHGPTWGAKSSGQDSALHLCLRHKGHSFEDSNVNILAREERGL